MRNEELKPYLGYVEDQKTLTSLPEKEYQLKFSELKKHANALWEEEKREAKKQSDIQAQKDAELAKQKKENEEIQKQLQAKKDAELKAENERKEQEKAEAKKAKDLLKASDKIRLNNWVETMDYPEVDEKGLTTESLAIKKEIKDKFEAMKAWAKTRIESI